MKRLFVITFFIFLVQSLFCISPEEILSNADGRRAVGENMKVKIKIEDYNNNQVAEKIVLEGYVRGETGQ